MSIPREERLIVALDVPTIDEARVLVERIGDGASFYKIGLELMTSGGYFELLEWLAARDNRVFADLKFYDIPETVRRAVANLRDSGATFLTVHAHRSIMEAAAKEKGAMRILAVTVLTSFDERDLHRRGSGARPRARRSGVRLRRRDRVGARGAEAEGCLRLAAAGRHAGHTARDGKAVG
jgi:orotidine-5'-phosphate decarboxylase